MPAMGTATTPQMFFIVASTDLERAQIMLRRIRDRLDRSVELKMNSNVEVSARGIWMPTRTGSETLDAMVREVAERVTDMALTAAGLKPESEDGTRHEAATLPATLTTP